MEDLAAHAGLSVGTLYNDHRTKGDILIAIVAMEVEEVLAAGEVVVANPPRDVGRAILAPADVYCAHSLAYLTKDIWRAAMALSMETPNGRLYADLDRRLAAQTRASLSASLGRGYLRTDVEAGTMGELVFTVVNMLITGFVRDGEMGLDDLRERIASLPVAA